MSGKQETVDLSQAINQLGDMYRKLLETVGQANPELQIVKVRPAPKPKAEAQPKHSVAPHLVFEFVEWFIKTPEDELYNVKRGQWECRVGDPVTKTAHTLIFHSKVTENRKDAADVICIRPPGSKLTIFNASRIAYGTAYAAQKEPQAVAERCGAVPIPFQNVVAKDMAGLDLSKLQLVEWAGSERMTIPPVQQQRWSSVDFHVTDRHFAGAVVIRVQDKYFLFDADREEVDWCGFNPFFTQLPHAVKSIKEAYESLMPVEVINAVAAGKKVVRQGELFFVPGYDERIRKEFAKDETSEFFYDQLCERIQLSGAVTYNSWRYEQEQSIRKFLQLCETNNNGCLPGSTVDAEAATKKLVQLMKQEVGPSEAHYDAEVVAKELKKSGYADNFWRRNTHMIGNRFGLHDEVRARLRNSNVRASTPASKSFPFLFNARIGENTGGTQQHSPTVMYCPNGATAKNPVVYARGTVYHLGREHRPVYLEGWHRVFPNTAVHNWTVSGDVD